MKEVKEVTASKETYVYGKRGLLTFAYLQCVRQSLERQVKEVTAELTSSREAVERADSLRCANVSGSLLSFNRSLFPCDRPLLTHVNAFCIHILEQRYRDPVHY